MKRNNIFPIPLLLLLSVLTACGGGGGGGGEDSVSTSDESRLFIASNPEDQYYGSYLNGAESLTLFGDSTGTDDVESKLVYLYENGLIQITNFQDNSQSVEIGDYLFTLTPTSSGSTVDVTDPDGGLQRFEFDSDDNPITDTDTESSVIDSSCIASTGDSSFCMNLDSSLFPASYCTVESINTTGGGQGAFTSVSYSTAQLCAERNYPYLAESTVVEGWSAWYQEPVAYSPLSVKALSSVFSKTLMTIQTADNPFDTSACHDGMYTDDAQWETCMGQMLSDFKATSEVMFQPEIAYLIDTYYETLKPAWDKATEFVDNFSISGAVDEILATGQLFASDVAENAATFTSNVISGISQLFDDKSSGEYSDSYAGLENLDDLLNQIWDNANSTLAEPQSDTEAIQRYGNVSLPEAEEITCEYSERSFYYHEEGEFISYLQCEGVDGNNGLVFTLTENKGPYNDSGEYRYYSYLTVYENGEGGIHDGYSYQESVPLTEAGVESTYRSYGMFNPSEISAFYLDSASFAFGYGYTSLVVQLQDEEAVSCRDDVDDTGAWLISTNENKEACPYGKSADETLLIHQIKREDMWLETDSYQQYLSN